MKLYQGKYRVSNPSKYKGDLDNIIYRSMWEAKCFAWCDKNPKIKSLWVRELIFYTQKFKGIKYNNSNKLIDNFSSKVNFPKWEIIIRKLLD